MDENVRPDDMERITTPELAQAFIDEQVAAHSRAGGRQEGAAGPVRRRGFLGGGGAAHQGHRQAARPACMSTTACCARASRSRSSRCSATRWTRTSSMWTRSTASWTSWPAWPTRRQKRKIIGAEFIRVFEEEARKLDGIDFLAQGTIYPDIIESGTKTVKASRPTTTSAACRRTCNFELVEPLKLLFKDEVRVVRQGAGPARQHGLPPALPRPRPGRALPGRHHPRPAGGRARVRRHPPRGVREGRPGRQGLAVLHRRARPASPPACATASAPTTGRSSSAPSTPWTP